MDYDKECFRCGKIFKEGDVVYIADSSESGLGGLGSVFYCQKCLEKKLIELKDQQKAPAVEEIKKRNNEKFYCEAWACKNRIRRGEILKEFGHQAGVPRIEDLKKRI